MILSWVKLKLPAGVGVGKIELCSNFEDWCPAVFGGHGPCNILQPITSGHNHVVLRAIILSREVANSHTGGFFIRDTACFYCDSMNCDSQFSESQWKHAVSRMKLPAVREFATSLLYRYACGQGKNHNVCFLTTHKWQI